MADLRISSVEVKTDCQTLLTLLKSDYPALWYIGVLCEDISKIAALVSVYFLIIVQEFVAV